MVFTSTKTYGQICCCGSEQYEEEENFFVYNECGVQSNIVYFYMIPLVSTKK